LHCNSICTISLVTSTKYLTLHVLSSDTVFLSLDIFTPLTFLFKCYWGILYWLCCSCNWPSDCWVSTYTNYYYYYYYYYLLHYHHHHHHLRAGFWAASDMYYVLDKSVCLENLDGPDHREDGTSCTGGRTAGKYFPRVMTEQCWRSTYNHHVSVIS